MFILQSRKNGCLKTLYFVILDFFPFSKVKFCFTASTFNLQVKKQICAEFGWKSRAGKHPFQGRKRPTGRTLDTTGLVFDICDCHVLSRIILTGIFSVSELNH